MVDFDLSANLLNNLGIRVVAGSVDSVERTAELAAGLRLGYVRAVAGLDALAVARSTGAFIQEGDRTFLHATAWLVDPSGIIVNAAYSTGPIGRFTAADVLKKVIFEQSKRPSQ